MRIIALDLGNVWTGIAISDPLAMFAKPHTTVKLEDLTDFLQKFLSTEQVSKVVVGYPKTMRGTESAQTHIAVAMKEKLQQQFPSAQWILWDERLSSKQAQAIKQPKNKEEKLQQHAIAAAVVLQSYLQFHNQSMY